MKIRQWLGDVRERLAHGNYVNASDVPEEPEGPYRAGTSGESGLATDAVEVREREMVHGEAEIVYAIRCACGRRWFSTEFESIQTCPKCARAVLLRQPRQEAAETLQ
jgi:hypothetical protein